MWFNSINIYKVYDEDGLLIRKFKEEKDAEYFVSIRPDLILVKPKQFDWKNSECLF